jgi:hypothetical protein
MSRFPRIVAGRMGPFRGTREYREVRDRLLAEARVRHEPRLRGASPWRRFLVRFMIEREVRAEWDRIYPPGALYAAGGSL